ncbi:hypothetical protein AFE02nite_09850 [Actinotalea fermentans]|uniref:Methyltransferase type 11 domain-containing protein n=2 Tax=Actinotalea fermentans TaxID=43671 RepID=A0A511YVM3_9CELL|nr:hypothetical protein AFE02nite_09850 [Actinotalea fermentans]
MMAPASDSLRTVGPMARRDPSSRPAPGPARGRRGGRAGGVLPEGEVPVSTGTVRLQREAGSDQVTVYLNGVPSSSLDLAEPRWLEFEYMQQMAAVVDTLPPGPLDAVHLGAAACALPRWLDATRPGSRQLAVDVDAELVRLVREWFDLPRSPRLRLRVQDARAAVASLPDASQDVVVRDVFAGTTTPAELTTLEFATDVARVLRPGGVYLANCADRPPLTLARAEAATLRRAMGDVAIVAEPGVLRGRRYGNVVLVAVPARDAGPGLDGPGLARALRSLAVPARLVHGDELTGLVAGSAALRDPPAHG